MNNFDYTNLTTRELLEKALNGEIPIPRNNPQLGQSKYFFMKTGSDPYASINDAEIFDVPDDVDPFEFRDNGYTTPLANSWDSALADTSTSALTSSLEDTSLNSFSNSNAYLSALNPLQQNTNSYLNALTPLQQNSNSYLSTQNTLPQNNSLIDLLKQMFPLKTGDETTDLSSTQTPTDLMTSTLSTPLHQGVQNGLNAVWGSTPGYAETTFQTGENLGTKINLPSNEDLNTALSRHLQALGEYEGIKEKIYFDEGGLATIGKGTRITPERIRSGFFDGFVLPENREKLITAIEIGEQLFKNGLINKYPNYSAQKNLFDKISKGESVENLNRAELGAIDHLSSYDASLEQMNNFVQKFYEEEGYDRLRNFLKFKKINYNDLPMGMQEILLDISYNAGKSTPMYIKENVDDTVTERSSWNKLGDHLANKEYYKALSEIFRNVQDARNNYLFLRGMQDFGYLKDEDLIKIIRNLFEEQKQAKRSGKPYLKRISKDNYPIYQKRFNLPDIGPF